jgi:ArsR family transcriptional regulator
MYADVWLGFTELELRSYLESAGFSVTRFSVVHRDSEAPHFETILAVAEKTL